MNGKYSYIDNKPSGEDLFEGKSQTRTATVLCDIVKDDKFQVIGIDGAWGVGKSNLVKIVDNNLKNHHFFIYDVWGHQEDDQRRSLLIELTDFLKDNVGLIKGKKWDKKLKELLSKKKEITTENLPYLSLGFIFSLISIIYAPAVLAFKDDLDDWLEIESTFWKLTLVFFPIVIVILIYLWNLGKYWVNKSGFRKSFHKALQETFQIYTNRQTTETKIENISEDEPSAREFKKWMDDIDADLLTEKLVIVLDNFDRLPKQHIVNVWSSIHLFFADKRYKNIKILVPFDREHVRNAFSGENENYADDYINKTFDTVFRVAPPILSSWRRFFQNMWEKAFKEFDPYEYERVVQAYEILRPNITPREVVAFVNSCVSQKMLNEIIPDQYIAIYILRQQHIDANPLKSITDLIYLEGLSPFYSEDEDFARYITALSYAIDPENALEVIYSKRLKSSLQNGNIQVFNEISETPVFSSIIISVLHELESFEKPIVLLDSLKPTEKLSEIRIQEIWNIIYSKRRLRENKKGRLEDCDLVLLKNVEDLRKSSWLTNILSLLWEDDEEEAIISYIKNVDSVIEFCNNLNLQLKPVDSLIVRKVSPKVLKAAVDLKQSNFTVYKIEYEIEKVDEFLLSLEVKALGEAFFINHIDDNIKLNRFREKLYTHLASNKAKNEAVLTILSLLKFVSTKKLEVSDIISDADLYSLMDNSTESDLDFVDLAAIRLSLLDTSSPQYRSVFDRALNIDDISFLKNIAHQVEWYIDYDDLLIGSIKFSNPLVKGVVKELVHLDNKIRVYRSEDILKNILYISEKNDLSVLDVLNSIKHFTNKEEENKGILNLNHKILKEISNNESYATDHVIGLFNRHYRQLQKPEWEEIFKNINNEAFLKLRAIGFNYWNVFAFEEFKSLLLRIADETVITNHEILKWLLDSFKNSSHNLNGAYVGLRDRLIRNSEINPDLFNIFLPYLVEFGDLNLRSIDVVRTVLNTELLDDEASVQLMLKYNEFIRGLLIKGGARDEFRRGIEVRRDNSSVRELGERLGFKFSDPEENEH